MIELMRMPETLRSAIGPVALVVFVWVGSASCDSSTRTEGATSPAQTGSASTSVEAESLDGLWSTGPVPIEDIRAAMLAAELSEKAVDGWIKDQQSPPEIAFELQFDSPDFSHSREDVHFPLAVDESGTYTFAEGQLRLSFPDLGDAYVFDVTLSDDTLSLELVDQTETGTSENFMTHRIYTIALYASAPFVRQPQAEM
jgi:hypothetical protein